MKITAVELTPFQMTRRDKEWRTSLYSSSLVDCLAVQIRTDEGVTGVGSAAVVRVMGASVESYQALIEGMLAPILMGEDPFAIGRLMGRLERVARNSAPPLSAIDVALHDLKGKALGVPVYELLGGAFRLEVPVIRMMGIKEPDDAARSASAFVDDGYRFLKIKIGSDPVKDVQRVAAVREAVGQDVMLSVDANGAYDIKTAIRVIHQLEALDVEVFEEPVRWEDLHDIGRVTRAVGMPVMGDQSITSLAHVVESIREDAVDAVCIKLHSTGGLLKSQKALAMCDAAGLQYHIGGTATSWVESLATLHLAVASANPVYGVEVGEHVGLDGDIAEAIPMVDGKLRVSDQPGLGVEINL